ncbi:MAG: TolC family protein [Nitrospirae bacterium]|nr:TolC family protein [Nitrospirota bacterium]
MTRTILTIILLIMPFTSAAEEIIKKGEVLDLVRCIEVAMAKQPGIIAAAGTVKVNESRVGQAASNYYPQIDWSSGYSRLSRASDTSRASTFSSADDSGSADQYTSSVSLRQNIFDFGKTEAQVQAQNLTAGSSRADLDNISAQVVLNVKQAYYGVLQAKRNRAVADETVEQFRLHLEQAKGFYEAGARPKFDVTKAQVDLSNARLSMVRAENALRTAVAALNNALGVPEAPEYDLEDNLSFQVYEITFEDAIGKAYENRPDLESLILRKRAAQSSVTVAEKGHYPVLTGSASYIRSGEDFPLDDGWNAGITLSFPIFSGFLTKHQVLESKANVSILGANEEALRQTVFLEVKQSYLDLREAEESIPAAELVVKQAEENLDLATGRYAAGVGNPVEVTDAQVALSSARLTYIQALYDYKIARANIEKAMGER